MCSKWVLQTPKAWCKTMKSNESVLKSPSGKIFLIIMSRRRSVELKLTIKTLIWGKPSLKCWGCCLLLWVIKHRKCWLANGNTEHSANMCAAGIAGNEQLETIHLDSMVVILKEWFGSPNFIAGAQKRVSMLFNYIYTFQNVLSASRRCCHFMVAANDETDCKNSLNACAHQQKASSGSCYQNHLTYFQWSALLDKWSDWLLMQWTHGKS